jgi:hypothetical protein
MKNVGKMMEARTNRVNRKQTNKKANTKGRGSRKRKVGTPPVSIRQQLDADVRGKVCALEKPVSILQAMSTPITRTDGWKAKTSAEKGLAEEEKHYPVVMFGGYCYTEQKPNLNGNTLDRTRHGTPELHLWTGCHVNSRKLQEVLEKGKKTVIIYHDKFESFNEEFVLKSNKKRKKKN